MYRRFSIRSRDNLGLVSPNNKTLEQWQLKVTFIACNHIDHLSLLTQPAKTMLYPDTWWIKILNYYLMSEKWTHITTPKIQPSVKATYSRMALSLRWQNPDGERQIKIVLRIPSGFKHQKLKWKESFWITLVQRHVNVMLIAKLYIKLIPF